MSGFAVIHHRDGRAVEAADMSTMMAAVAHRARDGSRYDVEGSIGLGFACLATTPETPIKRQPLVDAATQCRVVADCRLDNRVELSRSLRSEGVVLRGQGDAELVLAAYLHWGTECPARLLGDFAFVVWDAPRRRLFCARDPLGKRPFCYYYDGRLFLAGSEIQQILAHPRVPCEPNEAMVGEYLACAITSLSDTLFAGVSRLPPGHSLTLGSDGLRVERFWSPEPDREVRYRTDAEYSEALLDLLNEAVRCRCRSQGRIGAELSGGLDSTSVVSVVRALQRRGELDAEGFETFSMVFPGEPHDESSFIGEAADALDVRANLIDARDAAAEDEALGLPDLPFYPNGTMAVGLKRLAAARGVRVLLTGFGGDDWLTGSAYHLADHLRRFDWRSARAQLRSNRSAAPGAPAAMPASFFRLGLLPLVPAPARRMARRVLGRGPALPFWLPPAFAKRAEVAGRISRRPVVPSFPHHSQRHIFQGATCGVAIHGTEMEERLTAAFGLEQRHPFDDVRLVEWALAIPEDQRWRGDETKAVLRRAMTHRVPERIRQRRSKAEFSPVVVGSLLAAGGGRLFDTLTIEEMGWAEGAVVRPMFDEMINRYARGDGSYCALAWPLWTVHAIEIWFRSVFGDSSVGVARNVRRTKRGFNAETSSVGESHA